MGEEMKGMLVVTSYISILQLFLCYALWVGLVCLRFFFHSALFNDLINEREYRGNEGKAWILE
jgi:hypothetical protein